MLRVVCSPLFSALAALALLLVGMELVWPGFFLHDDNASWFAGAYAHDFRTLTQSGELAEVNFYQYGGEPFLEQGQTAVLYPPVYVAGALASLFSGDLRATVDWLAAIHLALAVVGFYVWLRRGGADAWVAALGGLVWALNPFVLLLGASWVMVTAAVAWLPWLFWTVDIVVTPAATSPGCGFFFNLFRGWGGGGGGRPPGTSSRVAGQRLAAVVGHHVAQGADEVRRGAALGPVQLKVGPVQVTDDPFGI
jgi:hypothetical protein